jgi:hypothetical protein
LPITDIEKDCQGMVRIIDSDLKTKLDGGDQEKLSFGEIRKKVEIIKRGDRRNLERKIHNSKKLGNFTGLSVI